MGKCNVHFCLDNCRINNSPYEQDEPREIVVDYEHEQSVKDNSLRDQEVQQDVRSPPVFQLGLFHLQHNLMRSLNEMTHKQEQGEKEYNE